MNAETVIAAWIAWDREPVPKHTSKLGPPRGRGRAVALENAIVAYVGQAHATQFRRFVTARRRAGRTVAAAVYAWRPP